MKLFRKIQNSKGQIADIIMFTLFISFVSYFIFSYSSMQVFFKTQNLVDEIVRTKVEEVRTKGVFTTSDYNDLLTRVGRYGNFDIIISLQARDSMGNLVTYMDPKTEILDVPLKIGDFIKIVAQGKDRPFFAEMLSRNFLFGFNNNTHTNFRMQSLASGMICTDGFIRGLEVMNIIANNRNTATVTVKTLLNPSGVDYDASNAYTVSNSSDPNWIKPDGRFQEVIDRDPTTNTITHITMTELISR